MYIYVYIYIYICIYIYIYYVYLYICIYIYRRKSRGCRRKSSDASHPVNLYSVNHRLTRTWYVPLSLASTWLVPLSMCDHLHPSQSQEMVYNFSSFIPTNKQINKR